MTMISMLRILVAASFLLAKAAGQAGAGLPNQNIPNVRYEGPNPPCDICRDGDYPYTTSMVLNYLYMGEGTCAQYYVYGLQGRIQQHMCDPVKVFAYEPCGCGQFNPYFNPNHPANNRGNAPNQGGGQNTGQGQPQQRRDPSTSSKAACFKLSNNRGGAGAAARGCGRRTLEESHPKKPLRGSSKTTKKDYGGIAVVVEEGDAQDRAV